VNRNARKAAVKGKRRKELGQSFAYQWRYDRLVRSTEFGRGRFNQVAVPMKEVESIIISCFHAQAVTGNNFTNGDVAMIAYGWSKNQHPRGLEKVGVVIAFLHHEGLARCGYRRMTTIPDRITMGKIMDAIGRLPQVD